jgi:hypothetical protein
MGGNDDFCAKANVGQGKSEPPSRRPPDGGKVSAGPSELAASSYQQKFVDDYLRMRWYDLTDENREIVAKGIAKYEGGNFVLPNELINFLDDLYRLHAI